MKQKILPYITPIVFLLLILGIGIINFLMPDRVFSPSENRYLSRMPEISLERIFNGKFTSEYEKYITDQFINRDGFIKAKVAADCLLLKKEAKNVYFGKDGYLVERLDGQTIDFDLLDRNLARIDEFLQQNENAYFFPIETAASAMPDKLPSFATEFNQREYVEQALAERQYRLIASEETASDGFYYKTDHHWTSLGAYYGYKAICEAVGAEIMPISEFELTAVSDDFLGTLYTKAPLFYIKPEPLYALFPKAEREYEVNYNLGERVENTLYAESYLAERDKYSYFLGGNNAVIDIKTNSADRSVLLIKDSYSNSLAPILAESFSDICLLDLRYYNGSIADFIAEREFDDIVVAYNFSSLQSDSTILNITR